MGDPSVKSPLANLRPGALLAVRRHRVALWLLAAALLAGLVYAVATRRAPVCIAVANSLTGASAPAGRESIAAIEIAVGEANARGGIGGHPIELVMFDDESSAATARKNVRGIADGRCVAVLGHYLSTVSLAAGPGYRAARIPALTGTSFVDELTTGNPWYFRAQTTASAQGRSIAEYLEVLQGTPRIELIHSDDSFGRSFAQGFSTYRRERYRTWTFDPDPAIRSGSAKATVEALAGAPGRGMIVIGTGADNIPAVLMAVRRRGIRDTVVAAGGAGSEEFVEQFANEPEEKRQPGFFTGYLNATPPMIFDSAGAEAQAFAAAYRQKTHRPPSWVAAGAYDGARMMIEALRRAKLGNARETRPIDRERVRAALVGMNSPETGIPGLTQTLYFDAGRNILRPVRFGTFAGGDSPLGGRLVTANRQLVLVDQPELLDLGEEQRRGNIIAIGDLYYWKQRVIYTGIDFNRLNRIDVKEGTFNIDINLWMRFIGGDEAPTQVEFPALLERAAFDPARPVDASSYPLPPGVDRPLGMGPSDTLNYRLYRIAGNFKANFDLHQYPFDEQQLLIRFQNRQQRSELVTYVVDSFGLKLANSQKAKPQDVFPYSGQQQWRLTDLRYFVDSLATTSTLGSPLRFGNNAEITFAGFNAAITIKRHSLIYVVKTMVPLLLLVMVVFATLFLPGNLFRERINIPVTAILTSAVLLLSINNQLGEIGYMVAIEYIFYAFFGLCLATMLIGISHDNLAMQHRDALAAALARWGQVGYAATVLIGIVLFWLHFD